MKALIVLLVLVALPANAADLPCGPTTGKLTIQWASTPAAPNQIAGYRLYAVPAGTVGPESLVELGKPTPRGGVVRKTIPWDPTVAQTITLAAYGPGGESARSNALVVPPVSSGPCTAPGAPQLSSIHLVVVAP